MIGWTFFRLLLVIVSLADSKIKPTFRTMSELRNTIFQHFAKVGTTILFYLGLCPQYFNTNCIGVRLKPFVNEDAAKS